MAKSKGRTRTRTVRPHHEALDNGKACNFADYRALHNSMERRRREALNVKFAYLAQQLPSLSHKHRPSKPIIIDHCLYMVAALREAQSENNLLRQQIMYLQSCSATRDQKGLGPHRSDGTLFTRDVVGSFLEIPPLMLDPQINDFPSGSLPYALHPLAHPTEHQFGEFRYLSMVKGGSSESQRSAESAQSSKSWHMSSSPPEQADFAYTPNNSQFSQPVYKGTLHSDYHNEATQIRLNINPSIACTEMAGAIEPKRQLYNEEFSLVHGLCLPHTSSRG